MSRSTLKPFLLLCIIFFFFTCNESKSTESKSGADVISKKDTLKENQSIGSSKIKGTDTNKYKIPSWPEKPRHSKGKLFPFDDAAKDDDFIVFRQRLFDAAKEKDVKTLLELTSDKIHFSYGDTAGKDNFIKFWKLDTNPEDSGIWNELIMCIELGGKFNFYDNKKRYAAPYLHVSEAFEDPYEEGVIVGDNVRLREKPSSKAKILSSLSWDMFEVIYEDDAVEEEINGETHYWMHIKTINGIEGYVFGKYARSPIDYRVGFAEVEKGKWEIEFFIAGD